MENICHNPYDQSKVILCFVPITQWFVFKRYNSDFWKSICQPERPVDTVSECIFSHNISCIIIIIIIIIFIVIITVNID